VGSDGCAATLAGCSACKRSQMPERQLGKRYSCAWQLAAPRHLYRTPFGPPRLAARTGCGEGIFPIYCGSQEGR